MNQTMDPQTLADTDRLIRSALAEDLGQSEIEVSLDCTTGALVPPGTPGQAALVARAEGIVCGLEVCQRVIQVAAVDVRLEAAAADGATVSPGQELGLLTGDAGAILVIERTCLNFLGRLSGIATLTREFVRRVEGTQAKILDTRKTTPGWRRLEKFAVACGGGTNHRMGLYDAVLIKDNHLALRGAIAENRNKSLVEAIDLARHWIRTNRAQLPHGLQTIVEVEVDRIDQLIEVLTAKPDIVLLDNMSTSELKECVQIRNRDHASVQLEASGGVRLDTVAQIAQTGVERISVGALTHSAVNFDIGLDWRF